MRARGARHRRGGAVYATSWSASPAGRSGCMRPRAARRRGGGMTHASSCRGASARPRVALDARHVWRTHRGVMTPSLAAIRSPRVPPLSASRRAGVRLGAALVAALVAACDRGASSHESPAPRSESSSAPPVLPHAPNTPPTAPAGTRCDDMTAEQCLQAPRCVLERRGQHDDPPYLCRDAAGPCEGGVAQFDANFRADCAARAGCRFEAPVCFCPTARTRVPGPPSFIACACGGGNPPRCVAAR